MTSMTELRAEALLLLLFGFSSQDFHLRLQRPLFRWLLSISFACFIQEDLLRPTDIQNQIAMRIAQIDDNTDPSKLSIWAIRIAI